MKYFLVLFIFGIFCQNILARGLDDAVLSDFERRLVRLETRQLYESQDIEHRMLQLEIHLETHQKGETLEENPLKRKFNETLKVEKPAEGITLLQRLEKLEKNWEKELEKQLAEFSSKYENLAERFSAIEKHVEEHISGSKNDNSKENQFQKIGTNHYFIERYENKTWYEAVQKCNEMNAHLLMLRGEEWSDLKEALNPDHTYWTDVRAMPKISNNFDDNKPNSAYGAESCLMFTKYETELVACNDRKYYICESNDY